MKMRYIDHSVKQRLSKGNMAAELKEILCILAVEAGMVCMAFFKGIGQMYLPVALLMMAVTVAGCLLVNRFGADRILLILVLVLLNLGFLVQQIQARDQIKTGSFLKKMLVVVVVAAITVPLYAKCKLWLSKGPLVIAMMTVQYGIGVVMLLAGQVMGDMSSQGAAISFMGITPFEIVKIFYIFVAARLLGDEGKTTISLFGKQMLKEWILVIHTMLLAVIFILCSELGTLMIVYICGLIMLWNYGKSRKWIVSLILLSGIGVLALWLLCEQVLMPMLMEGSSFPGPVAKIICRFGTVFHPEKDMFNYGYQGICGLEAIAVGGWLGIGTEVHRTYLPEAANDFIFANVIQTCGLLMGIIVVVAFFAILKRGIAVAEKQYNPYLQRVAMAVTVIMATEAVIHIGYNIAALPITGIPLYFVSQGFTAVVTGMVLITVLLIISADKSKI